MVLRNKYVVFHKMIVTKGMARALTQSEFPFSGHISYSWHTPHTPHQKCIFSNISVGPVQVYMQVMKNSFCLVIQVPSY